MSDPGIGLNGDPLVWWRRNRSNYSNVARLARYYLAMPGASAAPESSNSEAGFIVDKRRSSTIPASVARLVFIKRSLNNRGTDFRW